MLSRKICGKNALRKGKEMCRGDLKAASCSAGKRMRVSYPCLTAPSSMSTVYSCCHSCRSCT
ncbi:hypothetical protein H206_05426 [Candidatus Electrothrix aarhusensis]|uniref:Uncharacterized protein n=1 Tax=Candidatus Electrothrix aarhusensis TaxID=1859131 RepID=A0A3S4TD56_9BACT|nr:hypothetical protein H206_05426 [Candidatus Electrothrix aarhusensis]